MESHINAQDIRDALVGYTITDVRKKRGGEFKDEQMTLTLRDSDGDEIKARIHYYSSDHELWVDTYRRSKKTKEPREPREHNWDRIGDAGTYVHETSVFECTHCGCRASCAPPAPRTIDLKDYPPCVSKQFMKKWRKGNNKDRQKLLESIK